MLVIALGHRSGVGKDTLARYLMEAFETRQLNVQIRHFASVIKDVSARLFGWAGVQRAEHYDQDRAERTKIIPALGMTVLELWVRVGQNMRDIHEDVWVEHLFREIKQGVDVLIIPDCRFLNEIKAVRRRGGWCVKVVSRAAPIFDSVSDNALGGFFDWDFVVVNDGTLTDLRKQAALMVSALI